MTCQEPSIAAAVATVRSGGQRRPMSHSRVAGHPHVLFRQQQQHDLARWAQQSGRRMCTTWGDRQGRRVQRI